MSESWVMVCHTERGEQYLTSYDPEAYDGRGSGRYSDSIEQAMRFDSAKAVLDCWRQVPTKRPVREDGKPNRPLTAVTIEPRMIQ